MTRIFAVSEKMLMVVERRNGHWQVNQQLVDLSPQCVAVDFQQHQRVYCGTFGNGLWVSDDAGSTWQPAGEGITHPQLMSVAVSPNERVGDYGVVYAGTEPSALFRSEDGGKSWQELTSLRALPSAPTWSFPPRPYTSHVRAITCDAKVAGRLFVAIEAGALVRSLDSGQTWEDRKPDGPYDTHTLAMHPRVPDRLYSAAGDGFMRPGNGFSLSDDAGLTWQRPDEGIQRNYLWGLAVDPGDPNTLIVSGANSPNEAHNPMNAASSVYRRSGDEPWQEVRLDGAGPQGQLAPVLASNSSEPGAFYAVSNRGLFRSSDAGRNWERIDIPWPEYYRFHHMEALAVISPD